MCKFIKIVNTVIQSHKALSLKEFTLALPSYEIDKYTVIKWLEFVFSRQVESLELNLLCDEEDDFVLGELLRESRIRLPPQTDRIFFQSLKRLWLGNLKASGEDIELLLRNCPLLEKLTIRWVKLSSDIQLCGANLALKHLDISYIRCNGSVKVSAPNLSYLRFVGGKLLLENVPKLVEANFHMHTRDAVVQRFASSASRHFSQLQILALLLSTSKLLFQLQDILANGFQIPYLKELFIIYSATHNHSFLQVTALIWAFPRLEEFKLRCTLCGKKDKQRLARTPVITNDGRSPHQHLKVFELDMYQCQNVSDGIVDLVMYISNNCVALRKIIIDCWSTLVDPATVDFIIQRLQGKVPNHIQVKLFKQRL